jgi:hypothetical protein
MTTGTQVNIISAQLEAVLAEIRRATIGLLAKGKIPNIADPADAAYFQRLDAWQQRVEQLIKHLRRLHGSVEGQRTALWHGGPTAEARNQFFRANQSFKDQATAVEKAQALARHVSTELDNLLRRSIVPTQADFERSASKLASSSIDFMKKLSEIESTINQGERAHTVDHRMAGNLRTAILDARSQFIATAKTTSPAPDYLGLATLMLTLLRILWLERIRKSRD